MRKTLRTLLVVLGLGTTLAQAQVCTPDPLVVLAGLPGVYPNPLITSNLAAGDQGVPYSERLTMIVPQDTTIDLSQFIGFPFPAITVSVNYQTVTAITGLPQGLAYTCDLSNCQWAGGLNGCIKIDGTPTEGGTFNVGMTTAYNVSVPQNVPVIGGQAIDIPIPGLGWGMDITAVGVKEAQANSLWISHNAPNPFHGTTRITYHAPKPSAVELVVTDLMGKVMHTSLMRANVGDNTFTFDASGFAAGVYLYRLSTGDKSVTSKMVVE